MIQIVKGAIKQMGLSQIQGLRVMLSFEPQDGDHPIVMTIVFGNALFFHPLAGRSRSPFLKPATVTLFDQGEMFTDRPGFGLAGDGPCQGVESTGSGAAGIDSAALWRYKGAGQGSDGIAVSRR